MSEFKISHDDDIVKSDEGLVFNPVQSKQHRDYIESSSIYSY